MDEAILVIPVEIPRAIYERQIMNLVNALLAIDDAIDWNDLERDAGPVSPESDPTDPKEVA